MRKKEMTSNGFAAKSRYVTKGGSTPERRGITIAAREFLMAFLDRANRSRARKSISPLQENGAAMTKKLVRNNSVTPDVEVSGTLEKIIVDLVSSERVVNGELGARHVSRAAMSSADIRRDLPYHQPPVKESYASGFDEPGNSTEPVARIPAWKRGLDLSCILISFPLWMPVMILVMLWIKLTSPGPVFYRQERVGYRKNRFMIFKFRTMHVNVETQTHERHFEQLIEGDRPMTKLDSCGDPRLIRCGRFLRAAGLDELPQLFNVVRGEMSLVGVRPCTVSEFGRYQAYQQERFDAPPGLTGYWQVNGKNKTTFSEMIAMDIYYSRHMSLRLDLIVLCKTLPAILAQVFESKTASSRQRPQASTRPEASVVSWNVQ